MDDPGAAKLRGALERAVELDLPTLVVTHTHDIDTDDRELYIGLPSMDARESAWVWKENLLTAPPASPSRQTPPADEPDDPSNVADAPVRLRAHGEKVNPNTPTSVMDDASGAIEGL